MPSAPFRLIAAMALATAGFGTAVWLTGGAAASGGGGPTLVTDASFNGGQPVLLDFPAPSGGSGPAFQGASGVARLANGKVVVAGYHSVGPVDDFDVARLNTNGSIDTTFGTKGYATISPAANADNTVFAMALQPDGKIVLVGYAQGSGAPEIAVARLTANGAPDSTFGTNGVVLDSRATGGFGVAVDAGGDIDVVAGNALFRYTATGAIDTTFGTGGEAQTGMNSARAILIQPDGKIVLAGSSTVSGKSHAVVARFDSNGTPDSGFGTNGVEDITPAGGNEFLNAVALQGTSILVGGATATGSLLARLTAAGKLDSTFGTGGRVLDPSGDAINALLYVPKPQDVSGGGAKRGTTTTGQNCESSADNGSKIKCTPLTTSGGNSSVDAMAQSCGSSTCTIDFAGQDSNTGKADVSQYQAADGGGTTSTTTTTTTSTGCAADPDLPGPCADLGIKVEMTGDDFSIDVDGRAEIPTSASQLNGPSEPRVRFTGSNGGPNNSPGATITWYGTGFSKDLPQVAEPNLCVNRPAETATTCAERGLVVSEDRPLEFNPLYADSGFFSPGAYTLSVTVKGKLPDPGTKNNTAQSTYYLYNQQQPTAHPVPKSEPTDKLDEFSGGLLRVITGAQHRPTSLGSKLAGFGHAKQVQVAVQKLAAGSAAHSGSTQCVWLTGPRARFVTKSVQGSCSRHQLWLTATGTKDWSYTLTRHLPAATYILFVRVVDGAGNPSVSFKTADGTRQQFTLTTG